MSEETNYDNLLEDILSDENNDIYSEDEFSSYKIMKDEHREVIIDGKFVNAVCIGKFVRGEANSSMITFAIKRFYDGVDLYGKSIMFLYNLPNTEDVYVDYAANINYSNDMLKFSWVLSSTAASIAGKVKAAIQFIGLDENNNEYSLKTMPFYVDIEDSLDGSDIKVTVEDNWFVNIEARLNALESGITSGDGTTTIVTVSNYNKLENLPSINGKTIKGQMTLADLNIAAINHTHNNYATSTQVNNIVVDAIEEYMTNNNISSDSGTASGKDGIDGKSAYELAIENGFEGTVTQWLDSLKGQDGIDGINGQDGKDGITPHIGDNGNWYIGESDTGVSASGNNSGEVSSTDITEAVSNYFTENPINMEGYVKTEDVENIITEKVSETTMTKEEIVELYNQIKEEFQIATDSAVDLAVEEALGGVY